MKVLLIDNFDSFTFNLFQYLCELNQDVHVVRNDCHNLKILEACAPDWILLSPGPSTPDNAGVCLKLVKHAAQKNIPLLGVCLGHQCIAQSFGAKITRSSTPHHGKTSFIHHSGENIFLGVENPFIATRYHSLEVDPRSLTPHLKVTATSDDNTIMALKHVSFLIEGLQFHPESILTKPGHQLIENFIAQVEVHKEKQ